MLRVVWDRDLYRAHVNLAYGRAGVELLHVGLGDLSRANVDDLPVGLGRSERVHMTPVLRAFFVFEPEEGVNEINLTCER